MEGMTGKRKAGKQKRYITEAERYQIEILLQQKYTISQAADVLGLKYHTVWHEVRRGTVKQMDSRLREFYVYKADYAQRVYEASVSNRGRNFKIGSDHKLAAYIEDMVRNKKYSPEALLAHARNENLQFSTTLCYKTIYNYLDAGLFRNVSVDDLPVKKSARKKKKDGRASVALNNRKGRSIEDRPVDILGRKQYGHWEMDTVVSAKKRGEILPAGPLRTHDEGRGRGKDKGQEILFRHPCAGHAGEKIRQ